MTQLYFAFGSNMSSVTLHDRGVDAKSAGAALLENHRLSFTLPSKRWTGRAADIRPAPGGGVWGVLWELAEPHALDPYELRYDRQEVDVLQFPSDRSSLSKRAFTYTVKPEHRAADEAPPADEYLSRMIEGAIDAGLPAYYTDFLRNFASTEPSSGPSP